MTRPSQASIDLAALGHNYLVARKLHGGRALAVVKANAYGHGALRCALALKDVADGFAVAFLDEAVELRSGGVQGPILLLEGCFDQEELVTAQRLDFWTTVHQQSQLQDIERTSLPAGGLHVWLKINSGMNRAGFDAVHVNEAYRRLQACPAVASVTWMTHFARADEPASAATARQIEAFDAATAGLPGDRSLCNSGGVLGWPHARRDWALPGIELYGADPMPSPQHGLIPVMTLHSKIFAVRTLQPGDALGYGGTFVASVPTRVGLVAIGYADGYPRSAPSGTPVAINGKLSRTLGRVSMDMMTVDLSDLPDAGMGSHVELWGRQIDVNRVAQAAGTISYELLCNVKRVPRVYTE